MFISPNFLRVQMMLLEILDGFLAVEMSNIFMLPSDFFV